MKEGIEDFAKKQPIFWAFSMASVSSLGIYFISLLDSALSNDDNVIKDTNQILTLIIVFIGFVLCYFYFKIFTFFKKFTFWKYLIISLIFITIYISVIIFSNRYIEELDAYTNIISVKEWSEDGYAPPEEVLSTTFCLLILISLNFITIFLLNLMPNRNDKSEK